MTGSDSDSFPHIHIHGGDSYKAMKSVFMHRYVRAWQLIPLLSREGPDRLSIPSHADSAKRQGAKYEPGDFRQSTPLSLLRINPLSVSVLFATTL